jgi:hypothetical protein
MTSNNNSLGQNNSYKSEKTFVCSVNTSLHNKNRKPPAEGFDKQEVTIDGLINVIQKGEGWSCSVFKKNYRSQENFLHAQAVGIDIDKGMTLT